MSTPCVSASRRATWRILPVLAGLTLVAVPASAQTAWQLLNETGASSFKNGANTGTGVTIVVPAGAAATVYTTNFDPINLATGEKYNVTFGFSSTAGITGAGTGNRIVGIGLFDSNGTATFGDDAGMMTWIRSDSTFELRQKNGVETGTESLLKFGAYGFTNLGTGTGGTAGALTNDTAYSVAAFQVDYTGTGYRFGTNTSTNPGLSFSGGGVSRQGYTNPGTITSGLTFDTFAVYFWNTSGVDAEFTIANVSLATAIPEPSTYAALLGLTVLGLVAWRRRRQN